MTKQGSRLKKCYSRRLRQHETDGGASGGRGGYRDGSRGKKRIIIPYLLRSLSSPSERVNASGMSSTPRSHQN